VLVEEEAQRADDLAPGPHGDRDRPVGVQRERGALEELALERLAVRDADDRPRASRMRDRRACRERQPQAGRVRLRADAVGVDHDHGVAVDQAERASAGSDERGRPRDQRMRDVGGRDRCRERRGEILHPGHLLNGRLRRVGGDGRAPASPPHDVGHPDDAERDGEVDPPAREGVRVGVREPFDGVDHGRERERPCDRDRRERRPETADHDDDGDDADERRVQRRVGELEQQNEDGAGPER
jgi:hypothetical protein